jgi:hypothetical protein
MSLIVEGGQNFDVTEYIDLGKHHYPKAIHLEEDAPLVIEVTRYRACIKPGMSNESTIILCTQKLQRLVNATDRHRWCGDLMTFGLCSHKFVSLRGLGLVKVRCDRERSP